MMMGGRCGCLPLAPSRTWVTTHPAAVAKARHTIFPMSFSLRDMSISHVLPSLEFIKGQEPVGTDGGLIASNNRLWQAHVPCPI